jgi:NAD(P)-dependent dehydrogenase (short-subunit alcohol dehydrogenase family)
MEISQHVAVVTGGGSGVGRSLCLSFARQGAAGVVVADLDADAAAAVAAEIAAEGHPAIAVPTDVAVEADVQALVGRATAEFGRIDLFCSNAGIIVGGGIELPDADWTRMWAVNVQSHIYVARAVLPAMLERGSGYLMLTASAAGLLTQLGSAPYAVTKHAAVALAEWLSITYGDQGLTVSCLCPQAFTSNLLTTSRRQVGTGQPAAGSGVGSPQAAVDGVLTADQVAATALAGVADDRFLILPHPQAATYERRRADDRERWLRGMRSMQARLSRGGPAGQRERGA